MIRTYRKRPLEVEAAQLRKYDLEEILEWMDTSYELCEDGILIQTLEGRMLAGWGDWIAKGPIGEFYPIKHEVFEMTYDTHTGTETE